MLYFALLFALILLALSALFVWLRVSYPSKQTRSSIHQEVSQAIALGSFEQALKTLKPLIIKNPHDTRTVVLHAQILRGMEEYTAALAVLQETLAKDPKNLKLVQERGRTLLEQGHPDRALEDFNCCSQVMRNEGSALDLATAHFQVGHVEEAWTVLQPYALESSNGRLLALAGDCHFHWQNFELAVGLYQQAQHYGWSNQQTLARTGHGLRSTGNLLEAERYFRSILAYDSSDISATLGLGTCLEARGQFDRALMIYQGGQAWDEGDPRVLRQAGICAVHTKQYPFAELYLTEAVHRGAKSPQALAFLGYCLEAQKKWKQAEQLYLQLTEEYPDHVAGYRALAWLYGVGLSSQLTQEQGLAVAQQALQLLPDAISWELLSACEARAGNFVRAHHIQEHLSQSAQDKDTQNRRRLAMRTLRKNLPLDENHLPRELVA